MLPSRVAFAFGAVLAASPVAFAWPAHAAETVQPSGLSSFLSPEQRAMLLMEYRGQWHSMSREEHRALRNKLRDEWLAMTPEQREKRRAELQAQWDALPGVEKMLINARMERYQERHAKKKKRHDS